MTQGAAWHFSANDKDLTGEGNLKATKLNSLDQGGNVYQKEDDPLPLRVNATAMRFMKAGGVIVDYAGDTDVAVADNSTLQLYLDAAGTLVVTAAGFPGVEHVPLAEVVTASGAITSITDKRTKQITATALGGGASATDITRPYTAGVGVNDAVYQKSNGEVDKADASGLSTAPAIGFVTQLDVPASGQCTVRFAGDLAGFSSLTVGKQYILAAAPGLIVAEDDTGNPNYPDTTPSSGEISQEVGIAGTATVLFVGTNRDFEVF